MLLPYAKMNGAKNRFVVLDGVRQNLAVSPALARFLADHKRGGPGCDQVLLLQPAPPDSDAHFTYRVFNADGGEVGQCGNGARCAHLFLRDSGIADDDEIVLLATRPGKTEKITVRPGDAPDSLRAVFEPPKFEPKDIPLRRPSRVPFYNIVVRTPTLAKIAADLGVPDAPSDALHHAAAPGKKIGGRFIFAALSLGNPHAVLRVEKDHGAKFGNIGRALNAQWESFPAGINVGFYHPDGDNAIRLRVYERGVGETKSCGTGACAAAVVAVREGEVASPVVVRTRGGELLCGWDGKDDSPVWMEGVAVMEKRGEVEVPENLPSHPSDPVAGSDPIPSAPEPPPPEPSASESPPSVSESPPPVSESPPSVSESSPSESSAS